MACVMLRYQEIHDLSDLPIRHLQKSRDVPWNVSRKVMGHAYLIFGDVY